MQESANKGHDSRLDPPCQSPTPAAPLRGNKMPSAAGFGNHQTNTPQNNYGAASQQPFAELGMASPTTQQAYQGVFDLTPMGNTLPAMNHRPHHTVHYMHGSGQPYNPATSPMTYQLPPMPAFGVSSMSMPVHPYYIGQTKLPPFYHGGHSSHPHSQPETHGRSNMVYYPNQIIMNHAQSNFYYQQGGHFPQHASMMPANVSSRSYMMGASKSDARTSQYGGGSTNRSSRNQDVSSAEQRTVRGPPRKPRQSGHALWIGNLPPQTDLMALVQHICQEAPGMESLFLISKSNCAFANYKDEATCSTAQPKLHDSKFQSVRLVSRLRRNTAEDSSGTTVPIVPAAETISGATFEQPDVEDEASTGEKKTTASENTEVLNPVVEPTKDVQTRSNGDKFFILKSLTTEDLDLSVRTGLWATQSHNEESLNQAFHDAGNVYLIFSANKSGEYFGYARMQSEMNDDPAAAIEFAPKVMIASEVDPLKAIPIDATEHAPRGKIIDDSARGTIFWEAERDESEAGSDVESETTSEKSVATEEAAKTWGKPFKLEWLSTTRLPFFRTRGLRNPWNSNREVKIARDGTEIEPSVGRRLIGLFNQVPNSTSFAPADRAPMNFAPVYLPMPPFQ